MINTQGSGFTLIDKTSTNKLSVIPDIIESAALLLSLMMTLLLYWWCGPSSSYLDQLTGAGTLSVLVPGHCISPRSHSGLHSALSPDNPWTETELRASQVRGASGGGPGEIVSQSEDRPGSGQPVECDSVYTAGPASPQCPGQPPELHLYHGLVICVMCHPATGHQPHKGFKLSQLHTDLFQISNMFPKKLCPWVSHVRSFQPVQWHWFQYLNPSGQAARALTLN